jgi:hypothetical protein
MRVLKLEDFFHSPSIYKLQRHFYAKDHVIEDFCK